MKNYNYLLILFLFFDHYLFNIYLKHQPIGNISTINPNYNSLLYR